MRWCVGACLLVASYLIGMSPSYANQWNRVWICNEGEIEIGAIRFAFVEYLWSTNGYIDGIIVAPGECKAVHSETQPSTVNVTFVKQYTDGSNYPHKFLFDSYTNFDEEYRLSSFCINHDSFDDRDFAAAMKDKYSPPCNDSQTLFKSSVSVYLQGDAELTLEILPVLDSGGPNDQ